MSTKTVRRPRETQNAKMPEWRRICHVYRDNEHRSICGTARRKPGEDHTYEQCTARGHTICVICAEIGGPEAFKAK